MKIFAALLAGAILIGLVGAAPVSLPLKDGSILKGDVTSVTPIEITVATEYGIIRVPAAKLTDEAKKLVGADKPPTAGQYEARIAQLEARIKSLEEENAQLRRQSTASAPSSAPRSNARPSSLAPEPAPKPAAVGGSYSISSTGKRHRSGCRYFGTGRACGPTDGISCKVCGG